MSDKEKLSAKAIEFQPDALEIKRGGALRSEIAGGDKIEFQRVPPFLHEQYRQADGRGEADKNGHGIGEARK